MDYSLFRGLPSVSEVMVCLRCVHLYNSDARVLQCTLSVSKFNNSVDKDCTGGCKPRALCQYSAQLLSPNIHFLPSLTEIESKNLTISKLQSPADFCKGGTLPRFNFISSPSIFTKGASS